MLSYMFALFQAKCNKKRLILQGLSVCAKKGRNGQERANLSKKKRNNYKI